MKNVTRKRFVKSLVNPLVIIVFAVLLRLLPHPPNVAPIAAMALFGGVYLDKKYALIIPMLCLFISDFFLGFHQMMFFVYGSFLFIGFIGLWLRNHKKIPYLIIGTLVSSFLFYLFTNFGVWLGSEMYPQTLNGLVTSYYFALPFFRNTIFGDIFYVGLFFGTYEFMKVYVTQRIVVA
jgi:hypothetical protein